MPELLTFSDPGCSSGGWVLLLLDNLIVQLFPVNGCLKDNIVEEIHQLDGFCLGPWENISKSLEGRIGLNCVVRWHERRH